MRIDVTQEDIKNGEVGVCTRCPVALAMRRSTGHLWFIDTAILSNADGSTELDTPACVRNFVRRFDTRLQVEPFSFDLALPAVNTSSSYSGPDGSEAAGITSSDINPIEP